MFNWLLFILSPLLALGGSNMPSVPGGQAGSSNVSLTTSGSCWNPDSSNTLTITSSMLDNVHAKYPSQPACYGDKVFFNKPNGVLGTYTLVRKDLHLITYKTDLEGGPYWGGCGQSGNAIRWIGVLPDGRRIWWADGSYANGKLYDFIYVETGEISDGKTAPIPRLDNDMRIFDVYASNRILEDPAGNGYGHVLECKTIGGIVPVVEENADLLPPAVVSFANDGKYPYLNIKGYEDNYANFAHVPDVTQKPGTIGPTIPPTSVLFPPTSHYIVKITKTDESLPNKAVAKGRIGTVAAKDGNQNVQYEVYFHAGEFYLRDSRDGSLFTYEASRDVPTGSVKSNPSLQLGVMNFRVSNEWTPYTPACKPAIYLYPPKPTNLSVQVVPDGYLTKSQPYYDLNWNVEALPDGSLFDIKNQKSKIKNNYLFYEAEIRDLSIPKEGWVVEKANVKSQISKILTQVGLNQKESDDFLAYWVPRLDSKPYYFVTLVPLDELNRKETLLFSQKPDTLIRVRMIFEGLDKPVVVSPLLMPTKPQRKGFTVVDWGGGEIGGNCEGGVVDSINIR